MLGIHLVHQRHADGGQHEGHVDDHVALQFFVVDLLGIEEQSEQVN